jgi:CRP/FNR family transcriptional regulator, cyclic AMP receptor protein
VDADRLQKLPLFRELSRREVERVARWADDVDVPAGRRLMEEGAFPHEFMVIESGTAEVLHEGNHLADLGPGDFFGEIALLAEHRRTATVTATSDMSIVVMHDRDFRIMEDQMPDVAAKIRAAMAARREEHRARTGEDA